MKKSYFIMLMALVFFLSGCREELDYVNSENTQNTYQLTKDNVKTEILHKTDYEKRSFLKPSVSRIENYLNTGSGGNSSLSKHTAVQDNYEIYTDTFEEVSYLDAKYHSFYIIGDPSSGIEEKLVLKSINNQVTEKYILKYRRLPDFSIDANSYQTVKITESSSGNGESLQVFTDSFSMGCSTYTVTYMDCEVPGYHHTNGEYCDAYNIIIPYNTVTVSFDPACTSGSQTQGGAAGNTGTSTGGAPANNTIPPGETPPVITLPTTAPLYIIQRPRNVICNPLDLNQDEIDQLNGNYNIRLKIYQYLALQGYSPSVCGDLPIDEEVQNFIKTLLQYFKDHPNAVWQDYNNAVASCDKLKKMLDTPASLPPGTVSIKSALEDLRNTVDQPNTDKEQGYNFRYNPTTGGMYAKKVTTWSEDDNSVKYEKTPTTFGGAHFHYDKLQGMFSHQDIAVLFNFSQWFTTPPLNGNNNTDYPMPVHMLVANGQVYALVYEPQDAAFFQSTVYNIYKPENEEGRADFENKFENDFNSLHSTVGGWNTDYTTLEKTFLKFVTKIDNSPKHYNLKVSLYRANSDLTNWEKLTISQSGNDYTITPNPCN
ncbi:MULTISPECIES: hypothetical protein [unclassified Chryseobacterium]|uniref:hypothetical protein n=1 Tax=unclassified Chryseobacterium TaxID=2593645 RepID=UPI000D3AD6F6|nr:MULTISPECIES: hypothetical protein [unclassified Chryseobacterium]PTT71021.1 hypothetical protein DBR25_17400 [Chryseobacterium sp. HMWF001]PVV50720.1 hypothetical protein DD829_21180 [Chryseobacterium sp. HMWF035]